MLKGGGIVPETVIYADVLTVLNIIVTYILICAARTLSHLPSRRAGTVIASFIGGFSALIIFVPPMNILLSVLYKILTAAAIVFAAFVPKSVKAFFKGFAYFLAVSFLFAGVMLGIELIFSPPNMRFINGAVYFDMSITFLVGSVLAVYGVLVICEKLLAVKFCKNTLCTVTVEYRGASAELNALYDTGNTARDVLNGKPLNIVYIDDVAAFFSSAELEYLKSDEWNVSVPSELKTRVHLVPCSSVGGKSVLKAFNPDRVEVRIKGKIRFAVPCTFAVTTERLSDGEYGIILNADIFEV